jgi:hypothetical protein
MTDFYVRWGDDVQPYVLQLASEHIETLRIYCKSIAAKISRSRRARDVAVMPVTSRVNRSMIKGRSSHRFEMFGFDFRLRENTKKQPKSHKLEYVLNFATKPDFGPQEMPARLRRIKGQAISARPIRKRRPQAAAPTRAPAPPQERKKKRKAERAARRLALRCLWIPERAAVVLSSFPVKLYKMYARYRRLSAQLAAMWRRRPHLDLGIGRIDFLTALPQPDPYAPARAWLEPRLFGESLSLLLFTFVSREPVIDWDDWLFGETPDEGERIPA